ncbi:MAG TPA: DUF2760 domain-containing protein [Kofleriaceae bacterium]|nr:DUF2760 domain-containing protein [Kofleriaceae bacterium]
MHPWLAIVCFFKVLFGRPVPVEVARLALPEPEPAPRPEPASAPRPEPAPAPRPEVKKEPEKRGNAARDGALALLALLQREARLVDFVHDTVEGAPDAAVGAAAREIHRACKKVFEQYLSFEPVMPGEEEAKVTVPRGFDPAEVRLIGEAKGEPPYRGTLRHHGWRVVDARLPTLADGVDRTVIAPAEVEL